MSGKIVVLRFREENRDIFNAIRSGEKTVETRAATVKYRGITAGDAVKFVCGQDAFEKRVKTAMIFKTVADMLKTYTVTQINPMVADAAALEKLYYTFPGYREKLQEFGLIALELE